MNGALLINKPAGISSFGVIDTMKKQLRALAEKEKARNPELGTSRITRRELPKLGHGGTLDPFATGLLIVCIGRGVKLSRYFLGSKKTYEATLRFGETTIPGDPTDPISETSQVLPTSIEQLQKLAESYKTREYLQVPPMHSAKKKNGVPLYELAREGIEIHRDPKHCTLHTFNFLSFDQSTEKPRAKFQVSCSSGTYIRTLAQDFARELGSVGMLDNLHRTGSGIFDIQKSVDLDELARATENGISWDSLPAFVSFDRLLDGYPRADVTIEEAEALVQGRQQFLFPILKRTEQPKEDHVVIYYENRLLAVAVRENNSWGLERVFPEAYEQASEATSA